MVKQAKSTLLARGIPRNGRSASFRKHAFKVKLGAAGKKVAKAPKAVVGAPKLLRRFYLADDIKKPLPSRKNPKTAKLKANYVPGTVLILLAGRFRGKRVVFLKQLSSGLLLITGPFKFNGVPLRRVNQVYTIATSMKVDVSAANVKNIDDAFFAKVEAADKKDDKFFGAEKPKSELPAQVKAAMKAVDDVVAAAVKKNDKLMVAYMKSRFSLRHNEFPHALKF